MKDDIFVDEVRRAFDWVAAEHGCGYRGADTRLGISIVYRNEYVVLEVNAYKGEIEESICLRTPSGDALTGQCVYAYDVWRYFGAIDDARPLARWDATREELRAQLTFDAGMLRKYCTPLLDGDVELFTIVLRSRR